MKVIMNTHIRHGLLGLAILILFVTNIIGAASSAATTTDNFTTRTISTPDEVLKSIVPIEVRGLTFIAERVNCARKSFELEDHPDSQTNDAVLTCLLECISDKDVPSVLYKIKHIAQEFGYIQHSVKLSPEEELQAQYKRLICMRRIIKFIANEIPQNTVDRYNRLFTVPKVDAHGNSKTLFFCWQIYSKKYKLQPHNTRRFTALQQQLKSLQLFQDKAVALAALKDAKTQLAALLQRKEGL